MTLSGTVSQNGDKPTDECLGLTVRKLRNIQPHLDSSHRRQKVLRDQIIDTYRSISESCLACYSPVPTLESLFLWQG